MMRKKAILQQRKLKCFRSGSLPANLHYQRFHSILMSNFRPGKVIDGIVKTEFNLAKRTDAK